MKRKRTSRPQSSSRVFVEDCARIDAEPRWTRATAWWVADASRVQLALWWSGGEAGRRTTIDLDVVPTRQHFGGERLWWRCPACWRACRVLLSPGPDSPFACRRCWGAVYLRDYPGRYWVRQLAQLLGLRG